MQSLPHFVLPFPSLYGYLFGDGGTLALIKIFLKYLCLLYAVSGGFFNTSLRYLFWPIIDLQSLACNDSIEGSLGSYLTANTSLLMSSSFFLTLDSATFLGIFLALFIDES